MVQETFGLCEKLLSFLLLFCEGIIFRLEIVVVPLDHFFATSCGYFSSSILSQYIDLKKREKKVIYGKSMIPNEDRMENQR